MSTANDESCSPAKLEDIFRKGRDVNSNIGLLAFVLMLSACSAPDTATRALDGAGYKDIEITGWKAWGCSDSDNFTTGFNATGPTGKRVSGVVCSGIFKGATIRTD